MKKILLFIALIITQAIYAQTTDLAISVEARNMADAPVSQVHIYEQFYYLVTITNSGNSVVNATYSQTFNSETEVISYQSQNELGGALPATGFNLTGNTLTATLPSMPANSSLKIKVVLNAPVNAGGISTSATVNPPAGTTDNNPSSNQSIIATGVTLINIDFTVTHAQVNPPGGSMTSWGGQVTYSFTITNNSDIDFPISGFDTRLFLNTPPNNGGVETTLLSLSCQGASGMSCPSTDPVSGDEITVNTNLENNAVITFDQDIDLVFPANSSVTFIMIYQFDTYGCAENAPAPVQLNSFVTVRTDNSAYEEFVSNTVITTLPASGACICTDIGVSHILTSGTVGNTVLDWADTVTIQTTVTNFGPEDTDANAILQNLMNLGISWQILTVGCVNATGTTNCSSITYTISSNGQSWESSFFFLEVGASVTFQTVVQFTPIDCVGVSPPYTTIKNTKTQQMTDCSQGNDFEFFPIYFPSLPLCNSADISVTHTQVNPVLPIGGSLSNTMPWDPVTYQVTITNPSSSGTFFTLVEYLSGVTPGIAPNYSGTLLSVNCLSTTGSAMCQEVTNANIGIDVYGSGGIFFEITDDDNWLLPGNSSITLEFVIDWSFPCSALPTEVSTKAYANTISPVTDYYTDNNTAGSNTFFATCVDLIVQTYPSSPTVSIDTNFYWIVDISNSMNGSPAVDIVFQSEVHNAFTINGNPICTVVSGNAQCAPSLTINGNTISGIIPYIDPGASLKIYIPVTSPFYSGSFSNTAEAQPNLFNNGELDPDTNISISSVQVLAPSMLKSFSPEEIQTGQLSVLTFTIFNIIGNPEQSGISFTDNLPTGITLVATPQWVVGNGVSATFIGQPGDGFVGVENLHFPQGVESCSFSVLVTAESAGLMINEFSNFSNLTNVDAVSTYATLTVIENTNPNLDVKLTKTVDNQFPKIGDVVTFTITLNNLSNVFATHIEVAEVLPAGYQYVDYTATAGTYDGYIWSIPLFLANEEATLLITALVTGQEDYVNTATIQYLDQVDTNLSNNTDSAWVTPQCFNVYNGMSPNLDNSNDRFVIECAEYYQNTLKIYNRLGTLIFEQDNYDNTWEGIPNRGILQQKKVVPVGTYYYVFYLPEKDRVLTGWLYINY